jgi:hypothetical protein
MTLEAMPPPTCLFNNQDATNVMTLRSRLGSSQTAEHEGDRVNAGKGDAGVDHDGVAF